MLLRCTKCHAWALSFDTWSSAVISQFVYLKDAFSPSLDEKIQILFEVSSLIQGFAGTLMSCSILLHCSAARVHVTLSCTQAHSVDNKLVVSYACTPAWG